MNRYWIFTLGLLLSSLLFWKCRAGNTTERKDATADREETAGPQVSDQLSLPFPPSWSNGNPPLLYYGREARFMDPRHGSDAINAAPAGQNKVVYPTTLSE